MIVVTRDPQFDTTRHVHIDGDDVTVSLADANPDYVIVCVNSESLVLHRSEALTLAQAIADVAKST